MERKSQTYIHPGFASTTRWRVDLPERSRVIQRLFLCGIFSIYRVYVRKSSLSSTTISYRWGFSKVLTFVGTSDVGTIRVRRDVTFKLHKLDMHLILPQKVCKFSSISSQQLSSEQISKINFSVETTYHIPPFTHNHSNNERSSAKIQPTNTIVCQRYFVL